MMNAKSELIVRQQDLFSAKVLLINPPVDDLSSHLPHCECAIWTWNFADYQQFLQRGERVHFAIDYLHLTDFKHIIIFNPKAKQRLAYVLDYLHHHANLGTMITLVGEKKAGIEGSAKLLQNYGKAVKIDNARHCQLWQMQLQQRRIFNQNDWLEHYQVACGEKTLTIQALAGVFSQQKLDIGTAQLLPYLSQVKSGKVADFGCGSGIIACYLAVLQPDSQIFAYDVDAFALASTHLTAQENQVMLNVQAVTGIADIADGFDAIVSNPPFHQGVETDYLVSEQLCLSAKKHLKHHGELWIVANQFLNYIQWLDTQFDHCTTKTVQQGFKVLYAQKMR